MVQEKVIGLLAEQLNINESDISVNMNIVEDLGADSLDVLEMLMALEENFNMTISDEEAKEIKTVADIITYIENKQ